MVATWHPAVRSDYYTSSTDYYTGNSKSTSWFTLTGDFGVVDEAPVEKKIFNQLFNGLGPNGKPLRIEGSRSDRRPGFDITFSAPKSVSLAEAFAGTELQEKIHRAHVHAVRQALAVASEYTAWARRGKNGQTLEKVSFTVALFHHDDARPAEHDDGKVFSDPNLHTHAVLLNLAKRRDGTIGAIHSPFPRDHKKAMGAVYHAALAEKLQALGFEIDRIGDNGIFEIKGVPDNLIDYFQARRHEIEYELKHLGLTSTDNPALAASIAKTTRKTKSKTSVSERALIWKEAAEKFQVRSGSTEALCNPNAHVGAAKAERDFENRVDEILEDMTARESVLRKQDIVEAVASALVGTGRAPARLDRKIEALIDNGTIVEIGEDEIGFPLYSTPEVIEIEQSVLEHAMMLQSRRAFALDPAIVADRAKRYQLSEEQIEAATALTSVGDVAPVEGSAGTGKSSLLQAVVDAYEGCGYRVMGSATAWLVANDLHRDLGIDSRSAASLLNQVELGRLTLDDRTVLVVDEAGLMGSREMLGLLQVVKDAGSKLILVGDREQLQPIAAGSGLGIVTSVVESARVRTIVRQQEKWARQAVMDFRDGKARDGLNAFAVRGRVVEASGPKASIAAAVDAWQAYEGKGRRLLIAKSNGQVRALNIEVRARMKARGDIHGPEVSFSAVNPSGHPGELTLAAGDGIRFLKRNDHLAVVNGSTAVITKVEQKASASSTSLSDIIIHASIGKRQVRFSPDIIAENRGRALLNWSYATTLFGSEGKTVENAVAMIDGGMNANDIYTAASRAVHKMTLILDAQAIDRQMKYDEANRKGPKRAYTIQDRLAWLAPRLSRKSHKLTTIDIIGSRRGRNHSAAQHVSSSQSTSADLEL